MRISARNQLKGTIIEINEGAVNGIVKIDIGGGNVISSTISMNAVKELGLAVGGTAYAVIKATSVMVAIDDRLAHGVLDRSDGFGRPPCFDLGRRLAEYGSVSLI